MRKILFLLLYAIPAFADPAPPRISVSLDIYNRDLSMVKDVRIIFLEKGDQIINFTGVAEGIFGHTSTIMPLKAADKITTKALTYNYDLVDQESLIKRFMGRWFSFSSDDATYQGRLLAVNSKHLFLQPDTLDPAIQVVDRGKLEEMFYPGLPDGLFSQPTLGWSVESSTRQKELPVEISYLTTGITWMCDYRGELIEGDSLRLSANFTISNELAQIYPDAKVALVVGKPHRSTDPEGTSGGDAVALPGKPAKGKSSDSPERLGELYRYGLPDPVDLKGFQTIQIPFFTSKTLKIERRYFFPHLLEDQTVASQISFDTKEAQFGATPLPEGDIGIYRRTRDGDLMFTGQDFIPITPTGGKVKLTVGQASDITARRVRLSQNRPTRDTSAETWRVEVVNGQPSDVTVWVEQRVFGYYTLTSATVGGTTITPLTEESGKLLFPVRAAGHSEAALEFTLKYGF